MTSARTIPLVDELLDNEKVFAMWTLGSPNTMKTYDKLNQRCVPQPFSMTGHPAWGDPVNHPWTTGLQLAYNTESVLWGAFVEQREAEFPDDDQDRCAGRQQRRRPGLGQRPAGVHQPVADPAGPGRVLHRGRRDDGADGQGPDDHAVARRTPTC